MPSVPRMTSVHFMSEVWPEYLLALRRYRRRRNKRKWRRDNPEAIADYRRKYRRDNPEAVAASKRKWRKNHAVAIASHNRKYRQKNATLISAKKKAYKKRNAASISQRDSDYKRANRPQINANKRRRIQTDVNFRLAANLRTRVYHAMSGRSKSASTMQLLGCTLEQCNAHLEAQFRDGMSWANRSEWHVDHIRPCASFDLSKPSQQRACFHYSNLQPLWAHENLSKGSKYLPNGSIGARHLLLST